MPGPHLNRGPAEERLARLDELAAELTARGWTAYVTTPRGRLARLFVQNPHDREMCADVMAAAESDSGDWWFWFGWAERIAPVGSPETAAAVIVTELRRPVDVAGSAFPAAAASDGRHRDRHGAHFRAQRLAVGYFDTSTRQAMAFHCC